METLQINKANALKAFNKAGTEVKELLTALFGKETFSQKVTDRVKTFEDACNELGIDPNRILHLGNEHHRQDIVSLNAYQKLIIIARALNEGWTPDWTDRSQYKYYPWLEYSGSGFSGTDCDISSSAAAVGSRLCFKSVELAKYAGTQFEKEYNEFFNL